MGRICDDCLLRQACQDSGGEEKENKGGLLIAKKGDKSRKGDN